MSIRISLVAQTVQNLPAIQETCVRSLGGEGPLEKGMATHSSVLAWRIPWTEKSGGLQFVRSQRVRHDWATNTHTHTHTHNSILDLARDNTNTLALFKFSVFLFNFQENKSGYHWIYVWTSVHLKPYILVSRILRFMITDYHETYINWIIYI